MPTTLQFIDSHQPPLLSGAYQISVSQTVQGNQFPSVDTAFHIAGPRFALDPQQVDSVFPPDGSLGDHENVLPHVALKRSTLPWERSTAKVDGTELTWLALLVFDQADDMQEPSTPTSLRNLGYAAEDLEPGQTLDDPARVIQVGKSLLQQIFPSPADLRYLAHVRQRSTDAAGGQDAAELAVILANRLPKPGSSSVAHLVSLEKKLGADGSLSDLAGDGKATFVPLWSWRFACTSHEHSFVGILTALNGHASAAAGSGGDQTPAGDLSFRVPGANHPLTEPILAAGAVALRHHLRNGQKSVSWYRGPFSQGLRLSATGGAAPYDPPVGARHGDAYLLYDAGTSMLDVSYAGAWELGRWLTLRNRRVAAAIFLWKRRCAQQGLLAGSERTLFHLAGGSHASDAGLGLPPVVADWLDDLRSLKHVPFSYLVPRSDMLPAESIRFFSVDPLWIDALLDGALSVARVDESKPATVPADGSVQAATLSGVLLRSSAVSYWPQLQCVGWSQRPAGNDNPTGGNLTPLRWEAVAPGVMLGLFDGAAGRVSCVDLFLRPEALHHGFVAKDGSDKLYKNYRDLKTGEEHTPQDGTTVTFNEDRRVDVAGLARSLLAAGGATEPSGAGSFGLAMIEGTDCVRIARNADVAT